MKWRIWFAVLGISLLNVLPLRAEDAPTVMAGVIQLDIAGPIGPATDDYIARAIEKAESRQAQLIVIRMDTPGGLDTAMRGIVKTITNSSIPVVTYVAPSGARAASAGVYILLASHIAAMTPGTNVGAATPVRIGTPAISPSDLGKKEPSEPAESATPHSGDAMQKKIVNDAVAYIRSLAELHGRNADWAESAVRNAASVPATEALKLHVIDLLAKDTLDLLKQLDGYVVTLHGKKLTLQLMGVPVERLSPDWRSQLLAVITNPNVAYILMLIAIYGLIFEFANPGSLVPGTIGAICLLLALYAFQVLPVNYAGMALIILGVALMIGEAFAPSFGMLGIGGILAFVMGSIILMDTDVPGFGISIPLIATFAAFSVVLFVFVIGMAIKSRRRIVVSGAEQMLGGVATVLTDFDGVGMVAIHGEHWKARCSEPLRKGQKVRVIKMDGLVLFVESDSTLLQENKS